MINKVRKTKETDIELSINTNSSRKTSNGESNSISIGVPFFEHMLNALLFYANIDAKIKCKGDLEVDTHHSLEDVGIVFGAALVELYQSQGKFKRFSSCYVPMDEALARVALDISGRPYFLIEGLDLYNLTELEQSMIEFLRSLTMNARLTVHIDVLRGINRHHIFEAIFKAYGMSLGEALMVSESLMSTKGCIE